MELRELLISLTIGTVWIYSGIILSLVKCKPCMYGKSYSVAKRYMTVFLIFSGMVIITGAVRERLFDKELECFCIFTLFCSFTEAVLLLLAVMNLSNNEECMGCNLWRCFSPVLILTALYFVSKLVFAEPEVYSIMELLSSMHLSPPVAIRFLIEFSIIAGVGTIVYKYLGHKKTYLSNVDNTSLPTEYDRINLVDKMLVSMILVGGLSVLDSVITWKPYSYIDGIISTGGIAYCMISFINYRAEPTPVLAVQEDARVNVTAPLFEGNKEEDRMVAVVDKEVDTEGGKEKVAPVEDIDENYYYTKKAVDKWIGHPDKLYLKAGITLKDASLGAGVSRRKLSDFIKSEYDCNFNTWINTLRIEEVKRIMLEEDTNLSLSYIADCTGFADLAGMSNTFKKVMGIPPSLYRKEIVTKTIHEELMVEDE